MYPALENKTTTYQTEVGANGAMDVRRYFAEEHAYHGRRSLGSRLLVSPFVPPLRRERAHTTEISVRIAIVGVDSVARGRQFYVALAKERNKRKQRVHKRRTLSMHALLLSKYLVYS